METWPDTLPQEFEQRGFRDELPDNLDRSTLRGEEKTREKARRDDLGPIQGQMIMTTDEWNIFLDWYRNTLKDGLFPFAFPDIDDPEETISVRFEDSPDFRTIGGDVHRINLSFVPA